MSHLDPRPSPTASSTAPLYPRADPVANLPILILYPHARCNCRCVMCDIWRVTSRDEITEAQVRAWLPDLRTLGVQRVVLSGGEPLMHSDLWGVCGVLHGEGIGITLLTTGITLRRHAAEVARYCDDVVVSLDGPPDVHDAIRRIPGAFAKVEAGIAALKAIAPGVRVTGRCTVQRLNSGRLIDTVRAARSAGFDAVSFLAADVSSPAFNRPDGVSDGQRDALVPDAAELKTLADEIEAMPQACADEFRTGFIVESPDKLRRRLVEYFAGVRGEGPLPPVTCNAPWVSSVVEADGTVRPCYFQPPLGNLHQDGGLDAVLNSPAARDWRRGLDTARDEICRRCVCSLALRQSGSEADRLPA